MPAEIIFIWGLPLAYPQKEKEKSWTWTVIEEAAEEVKEGAQKTQKISTKKTLFGSRRILSQESCSSKNPRC